MITPDRVYEKIAKDFEEDVELINQINKFYWKHGVGKAIKEGKYDSVYVKNIGTYFPTFLKVKSAIKSYIKQLKKLETIPENEKTPYLKNRSIIIRNQITYLLRLRNMLAVQRYYKTASKWVF